MLDYKAAEGIEVPAAYTSQTCSSCGFIDADSHRSQASFVCVACGFALNEARNISASGAGATARRGAFTSVTPVTREMDAELALTQLLVRNAHKWGHPLAYALTRQKNLFLISGLQIPFLEVPKRPHSLPGR